MERIAYKIAEKVETEVNIKTILRRSPEQAKKVIKEAQTVLNSWESTYMSVRQRIEESGTHIRWEFDRKRLFELTKYMAHVCGHLFEVATVLDQFHKFLGPELKAVTGESDGIDQVMERVERLVEPLESVPFNIFDRRYKESWSKVMDNFHDHVEQIEDMTRSFIEQSFQKLRSAEGAFELVENFRNIQSRESINQQINDRYKDILQQYTKELEAIHGIFDTHRENPPIYKNFPPVAGAVAWARDLYQRAKKPVLRFKAHEGLLSTEYGEQVKQRYLTFARAVDAYITSLYREWEAHVQQVATEKLKQPILAAAGKAAEGAAGEGDGEAPAPDAVKGASGRNKSAAKFKMPPPPYRVNFVAELSLIIRESKYLDRMGFAIPDAALNVTLQEDKYHSYRQNLQLKLRKYDALLASLSPVEGELLVRQLAVLQRVLRTGFTPLNWNSQRIPFFIEACDKALNEFAGVVSQIQKSSTMIDEIVAAIEGTVLAQASMWRDLISLQPRSASAGGGLSRDEIISNAAKDIQSKVPLESLDIGSYDTMIVRSTLYERNGTQTPTPCQVVLLQELERWNLLVIKMAVTLSDLQRAFKGEIGMSDELDSLGVSLFNGFIPDGWKKLMPNTQKPLGSWMVHFIERYAQYDKWIKVGEPAVIWLSGLGIPESYLTALVQTTCRMLNWPLDKSTMSTKVTSFVDVKEVPGALDSGTYVRGL